MERAVFFFPLHRTLLMTWETRTLRNTGSGSIGRFWAGARRISALLLGAVTGSSLLAVRHSGRIQGAPDHLVTHARQVADAATADEDDQVLLEVVTLSGDVGGHFDARRQTNAAHLPKRRVRLLRGDGVDAGAHAPALRCAGEASCLGLLLLRLPALADKLLDRRHFTPYAKRSPPPGRSTCSQ